MSYVVLMIAVTTAMVVGYWRGRAAPRPLSPLPARVRLSPMPPLGTVESLKLFGVGPVFTTEDFSILDRDGRWTIDMIGDFAAADDAPLGPCVWEGRATAMLDGWRFTGTWRTPTAEEMVRLAEGRFPLRDIPLPAIDSLALIEDA